MSEHSSAKKQRYVFQVIREDVVRTEIIKAGSQEEAERILSESDPNCIHKFLWIQKRTHLEKEHKNIWPRIFLILAGIFALAGCLLLFLYQSNYSYWFLASLACLLLAGIGEWWRSLKE